MGREKRTVEWFRLQIVDAVYDAQPRDENDLDYDAFAHLRRIVTHSSPDARIRHLVAARECLREYVQSPEEPQLFWLMRHLSRIASNVERASPEREDFLPILREFIAGDDQELDTCARSLLEKLNLHL